MKKTSTHKFISVFQKTFFTAMIALLGLSTASSQTVGIGCNVDPNAICPGVPVTFTAGFDIAHAPTCGAGTTLSATTDYYWVVNGTRLDGLGSVYSPQNLADGTVISCVVGYTIVCFNYPVVSPPQSYTYYSVNTITAHILPNYPNLQGAQIISPNAAPLLGTQVTYSIPATNVPNLTYLWEFGSNPPGAPPIGTFFSSSNYSLTLNLATSIATGYVKVSATPNECPSSSTATSASYPITLRNDPPTAPTNVQVTGSADVNSISLSWTPSNSINTLSYIVYFKDAATSDPYAQISATINTTSNLVTANITSTDLLEAHTYKFYVVATDTYNATSPNSTASDPYTIDHQAPPKPVINQPALEQTDNTVTFTWNQPMDDVGTVGYNIYLAGQTAPIATGITNTMYTASFVSIPVGYIVKAYDAKGNISDSSDALNLSTKVNPFTIDTVTGFVGIGVNPPSDKLDVDGDLKVRGDIIMQKPIQNIPDVFSFTGSSLDFFTPVQAQWNGSKPVLSMSQYGEMNFFSTPILNYNSILFKGSGDYKNGIGFRDSFGTVSGIGGPTVYGETGGALGTKQGSWNGPEQVALNWDSQSNLTTSGVLFAAGGLKLPDGGLLNNTQDFVKNGQSNVTFTNKLQVTGTDPYFKIGSLVMQDLSTTALTSSTVPGSQGGYVITNHSISNPDAIVFGNMYFDPVSQSYKSILSISDSVTVITVNPQQGSNTTGYSALTAGQNGGIAINMNSSAGSIEFVAVPTVTGNTTSNWSLTKSQLDSYKRMVIQSSGNIGMGVDPDPSYRLDVKGNERVLGNISVTGSIQFNDGTSMNSAQSALWLKGSSTAMYANTGVKVGIGNATPAYPLDILGTTGQDALHIGRGNLNVTENVNISGTTKVVDLFVTGIVHSKDVRICLAASSGGACPAPPDYVFQKGYKLRSLEEVEEYVNNYHHLPDVPSAKELEDDGMGVTEMNFALLKKVEELTLYTIELKKELRALKKSISTKK